MWMVVPARLRAPFLNSCARHNLAWLRYIRPRATECCDRHVARSRVAGRRDDWGFCRGLGRLDRIQGVRARRRGRKMFAQMALARRVVGRRPQREVGGLVAVRPTLHIVCVFFSAGTARAETAAPALSGHRRLRLLRAGVVYRALCGPDARMHATGTPLAPVAKLLSKALLPRDCPSAQWAARARRPGRFRHQSSWHRHSCE